MCAYNRISSHRGVRLEYVMYCLLQFRSSCSAKFKSHSAYAPCAEIHLNLSVTRHFHLQSFEFARTYVSSYDPSLLSRRFSPGTIARARSTLPVFPNARRTERVEIGFGERVHNTVGELMRFSTDAFSFPSVTPKSSRLYDKYERVDARAPSRSFPRGFRPDRDPRKISFSFSPRPSDAA